MIRSTTVLAICGALLFPGAADALNACAGKKIKAAAKNVSCQTAVEAKEVTKNLPKDLAKIAKCQATFAASFAKEEAKGGCLTTGDAASVGATVDAFVADLDQALSIGAPNKCQGAKLKAAAKKAGCKASLEAKQAAKGGTIDPLKWTKCSTTFEKTFAKLEAKGGCATTGDVAAVETTVDLWVDDAAAALDPGLPPVSVGPILHMDASDAAYLDLDGADVDGATDLSGSGNHLGLSTDLTAKPTFVLDGIRAGYGAVRFANGKALQAQTQAPFDAATFTAFVVVRFAAFDSWNFVIGDDSYQWGTGWGLEAAGTQLGAFANSNPAERVEVATDTTYVAAVVMDGSAIVAYLNGSLQTTDTSIAGYDPTPFDFSIGNSDYQVDWWGLDGWIGEVVFYPAALSAAEREAIEAYLMDKWL